MLIQVARPFLAFLLALPFAAVLLGQSAPAATSQAPPPAAAAYAKEPYVVELLQQNLRFEADGKGVKELTLRVRVQSEPAVRQFGLLVYPFAASFESLDVVYARVRKPDGTVVETPASDAQELDSAVSREAPMYTDEREKHLAIKSLSVGDLLEAKFRWTIHDPVAPGYFWYDTDYFNAGTCLKEMIEFDVPRTVPVKLHYGEQKPTIREEGDRRIYTFETAHLKKEEEPKDTDWEKNFYGAEPPALRISSFASWEQVGAWYDGLEKTKVAVTPEIRTKAEELTKGKPSAEEKIRALYDFVSLRIRYIGVNLGTGRYTPHAAAEVLANRYGDCKDKHTLLAALLQSVGIPAHPVLISTRFKLDQELPSPSIFDHVITAVPFGTTTTLLDTTPEVAPYGLLQPALRDREALETAPGGGKLTRTAGDPPFHAHEIFRADARIDTHGTLDAKMFIEERGDVELALRTAYRATAQNQWEALTQKLMNAMGFSGTVSNTEVSQPEDTAKAFTIAFDYHRVDFPDWPNLRLVPPAPPLTMAVLTDEQKSWKTPLPLGPLLDATHEVTIHLPKDYAFAPPSDVHKSNDFAEYSVTYTTKTPDVLQGTVRLKTLKREIPGNERAIFDELSTEVADTSRQFIPVKGAPPNISPLAELIGKTVPRAPDETIAAYEKAVSADPNNRTAKELLSRIYVSGGRSKDAVALLEKMAADNADGRTDPGVYFLLGQAYLAVPDGEKAFAAYQKSLGEAPNPVQLNDVARDLAVAGIHTDEAQGYAERAMQGMEAASVRISVTSAKPEAFFLMRGIATVWDTLGWLKFHKGDAAAAQPYAQASWDLAQESDAGEHLVEIYEKLGKREKAARICNMALAGHSDEKVHGKLVEEMGRLKPYLKRSPEEVTNHRTLDGSMALSDVRTLHVPFHVRLKDETSSAQFIIGISNGGHSDNIHFVEGAPQLQDAIADLARLSYPQSFPDGNPVRVLRKGTLSCSVYTKQCVLVLMPVADAAVDR